MAPNKCRTKVLSVMVTILSVAIVILIRAPGAAAHVVERPGSPTVRSPRYLVQPGDTLTKVSRELNLAASALAERNGIAGDRIFAGQYLFTDITARPGTDTDEKGYIVKPGDTLTSIVRRLKLNQAALAARNGLVDGRVFAGARLLTNVSASGSPPAPATAFIAKVPATDSSVNCPIDGHATFTNDWGFPRAGGRWHQGTDLMAARGTPVVAPVGGQAERAPNSLGGKAVRLRASDGTVYYFAHLESYGRTGAVKAGALLGTVGSSGAAEGGAPHLHFEVRPTGRAAVNPYPTVRTSCH